MGKNETLAGLDTYVSLPPDGRPPRGVVLLITDIFGAHRRNPRLWADRLAASGAGDLAVVLPDFFRGDAWPADAELSADGFGAWLARHPREKVLREARAVVEEAARRFSPSGPLPVSAVGFCWGALYATLLAGGPSPVVASAALLHPSLLTLDDFKAVEAAPLLVLFTANDQQVSDSFRAEIEGVLDAKNGEKKPLTAHHFYADQAHGFSLRGDDTDPKVAAAAEDAFARTAAWLKEYGSAK